MRQGKAEPSIGILPQADVLRHLLLGLFTLSFIILFNGLANAAIDQKRIALVIGNSAYEHTSELKNPRNDAKDMAAALRRLGFEVIEGIDLGHAQMRSKVREFSSRIEGADVALFYYAGHGVQVHGNNYLAPVTAKLSKERDLDFEAVSLNFIVRQMEREQRTNLVFLDACRDNPLAKKLARSMKTRSGAVGRGLARVESGIGMLIAYATGPGDVAFDGDGRNSPYTTALLKHIEQSGIGINDMMIQVRQDVISSSKGKQVPWEHSSLTGQFYFKPEVEKQKVAAVEPAAKAEDKTEGSAGTQGGNFDLTRQTLVSSAYQAAVAIGTCGAYKVFEQQHRGTFYARLAEEWIKTNCARKERAVQVEAAGTEPKSEVTPAKAEAKETKTVVAASTEIETKKTDAAKEAETTTAAATESEATEEKEAVVAALTPAVVAKPVEAAPTGRALALAMQKELARLGCSPGRPDGKWGRRSQAALNSFAKFAKLDLSGDAPSATALAALKQKTDRVCPLQCGARYTAKGDRCVRKVCGSGKVLDSAGQCVVRTTPKTQTKTVSKKVEPAAKRPARKKAVKPTTTRKKPVTKKRKVKPRVAKKPPPRRSKPKRRGRGPKEDRYRGGEDTRVDCQRGLWTGDCFPQRR